VVSGILPDLLRRQWAWRPSDSGSPGPGLPPLQKVPASSHLALGRGFHL